MQKGIRQGLVVLLYLIIIALTYNKFQTDDSASSRET